MATAAGEASFADEILDELLPEDLQWRRLTRSYPRACLVLAGAAGFWIGWKRGDVVLSALAAFATTQVGEAVKHHLEE